MIAFSIQVGDLLEVEADVIVSTANPWLNMSGGVNGAILARGGRDVQAELRAWLRERGLSAVEPGTVVVTGPGPLKARHILHAVAIDPFYDSSVELVRKTLHRVLAEAQRLRARSVALPALATGYGHLTMEQFASALAEVIASDWPPVEQLVIVVRTSENAEIVRRGVVKSILPQ